MKNKQHYSVKELARMAGVSVRTLHLYDSLGLLKPAERTPAGYRLYCEAELLRLQQILFYKEMDIPLQQIGEILDDPSFNLLDALKNHRSILREKVEKLKKMLHTVDRTIHHLKQKTMLPHEELYEGLSKEKAAAWRQEAVEKYGEEKIMQSEKAISAMNKNEIQALKVKQQENFARLMALQHNEPVAAKVQEYIAEHYEITRKFWGTWGSADKQAGAYKSLGHLYLEDERFTMQNGKAQPAFARFMAAAMIHYADKNLV